MPQNWWTRKYIVYSLALVALACVFAFVAVGLTSPEPLQSAALGPHWQCSRMAFVFTICSRVSQVEPAIVGAVRAPACRQPRTQARL
ncbi:MAG: hypothetical protein K2X57_03155 [Xanthobacteraceae bacterium]|nr:hypothetical protein [Xanthobacteraceae bacterium]